MTKSVLAVEQSEAVEQCDRDAGIAFLEALGFPQHRYLLANTGPISDALGEQALQVLARHRLRNQPPVDQPISGDASEREGCSTCFGHGKIEVLSVTQPPRFEACPVCTVGEQPWGYGWYDHGGKKHAYGYLPTIHYPRSENVSEGPFPLYAHPRTEAPAAVEQDTVERLRQIAALICEHHRTHVRQPTRTRNHRVTFHQGEMDAARAIAALTDPASDGLRDALEDAERWRAFISSDRFYVMGSAGFDWENNCVNPDRDPDNWLHLTLNIWDKHPAGDDAQGTQGRALLLAYVEHLRALARDTGL